SQCLICAATVLAVRELRVPGFDVVEVGTSDVDHAAAIAADDPPRSGGMKHFRDRDPGGADPGNDDLDVLDVLAHDAQGVEQSGERDDRRPVLVVVEDRDVKL